jgi:hypothetical protein
MVEQEISSSSELRKKLVEELSQSLVGLLKLPF